VGVIPDLDSGGVVISTVTAGSSAERAELQMGDVILKIGGTPVADFDATRANITKFQEGEVAELEILRDGEKMMKKIKLGSRDFGQ